MRMDSRTLQDLVDCEIIEIRGYSGKLATVAQAQHAPLCVQVHAMSGKRYQVLYNSKADIFKLTEVTK